MFARLDQEAASHLLTLCGAGVDSPFTAVEIRHLGAAARQDVPGGSAVTGRSAAFQLGVLGLNPTTFEQVLPTAMARLLTELEPWLSDESNPNFIGRPLSAEVYRNAWPPATRARLAEIRLRYDPDGLLGS